MHFLNIVFLALGAHAVPGHLFTADRRDDDITLSGKEVNMSYVVPFEPYPGYFQGKETPGGSQAAIEACRLIQPAGDWLVKQATCHRVNGNFNPFNVDCAAKANHANINTRQDSPCGAGQMCMEYHGVNQLLEGAWDVTCISYLTLRQWQIDTMTYDWTKPKCSPYYQNNVNDKSSVKISIQTNVLDSAKVNRIPPLSIFFQMDDGANIGLTRTVDPIVGSGVITVPYGRGVRSCVYPRAGQVLWVFTNIVGLAVLD